MVCGHSRIAQGYQVEAKRAVDILAESSSEAAEWWRQNVSGYLKPDQIFIFDAEACELQDDLEDLSCPNTRSR
jgi:hypothetical protein